MSEGIGARVLRKEDKRFITGKGRYTDDIIEANQAYAAFVRSPHAHARIVSLDASAALAMEGVETVLTGPELVADGIGNIICGWGITSKDGTPMNMGAWSALATEKCAMWAMLSPLLWQIANHRLNWLLRRWL
jgi:carbon-monoxide dehydrogenase large subunit